MTESTELSGELGENYEEKEDLKDERFYTRWLVTFTKVEPTERRTELH